MLQFSDNLYRMNLRMKTSMPQKAEKKARKPVALMTLLSH
jgi:hypothetical protein